MSPWKKCWNALTRVLRADACWQEETVLLLLSMSEWWSYLRQLRIEWAFRLEWCPRSIPTFPLSRSPCCHSTSACRPTWRAWVFNLQIACLRRPPQKSFSYVRYRQHLFFGVRPPLPFFVKLHSHYASHFPLVASHFATFSHVIKWRHVSVLEKWSRGEYRCTICKSTAYYSKIWPQHPISHQWQVIYSMNIQFQ